MITLVLARARNGVIGRGGGLPWHLPADLKHAAKMLVSHYYENREAATSGGTTMQVMEVPFAVTALLDRYKTFGLV